MELVEIVMMARDLSEQAQVAKLKTQKISISTFSCRFLMTRENPCYSYTEHEVKDEMRYYIYVSYNKVYTYL